MTGAPIPEKAEKRRVTLVSVGTALVLIGLKLFAGLATGYLTLMAEVLHSSLDALVTIITFFSIRYAERPADADHPYGHGKAENLAAFTESLLLFFAIFLIVREVVERLFVKTVVIEPNIWAVSVLVASVLCDLHRSRALKRVARKYKSPAIEADATHFRADLVTSAIALSGILVTYLASKLRIGRAYSLVDIVTTCLILVIVVRMVLHIMMRSADVLLDRTMQDQAALIKEIVTEVPEVIDVEKVRTREAGKQTFVDLTVDIDRNLSMESGYSIGKRVEETIKKRIDDVDVTLQVKPVAKETEDIVERIRCIGVRQGRNVHHIDVHHGEGTIHVDLDLEVEGDVTLAEAHALSDSLEKEIKEDNRAISEINTHIDWRKGSFVKDVLIDRDKALAEVIEAIVRERREIISCRRISVEEETPGELFLTIHCTMRPDESAEAVNAISDDLEKRLKERIGRIKRVIFHIEPEEKAQGPS
ncbi:MAG: cation diffusion facilitator family transporter [Syntrophorhabdales bacterium]